MPAQGDLYGLFHQCQFCWGLPHAKTRNDGCDILDLCHWQFAKLVAGMRVCRQCEQLAALLKDSRHCRRHFSEDLNRSDAGCLLAFSAGRHRHSSPLFLAEISGLDKQNLLGLVTRCVDKKDSIGLAEPREIVEIVFLPEFHEVTVGLAEQDQRVALDLFDDARTPRCIFSQRFLFEGACRNGKCNGQ